MQWSGTSLWHRLRAAEDALMSAISSWAGRRYGLGLFDDAWKAFGATEDLDAPPHQHPEFGGLFLLWLYFRFDPETHDRDNRRDAARPLALRFIDAEGDRIDSLSRRFAEATCARAFSFHQVTSVEPGQSIGTRDLMTGDEHRVSERSASRTVRRGSILFARIVELDGVALFMGCGSMELPSRLAYPLFDLRDSLARPGRALSSQDLIAADDLLRHRYFEARQSVLHPKLPKLRNTDGDPLEPIRLEYRLRCPPVSAFDALASLSVGTPREECLADAERRPDGALRAVTFSWLKKGNRQHRSWDNTILGTLTIEDDRLRIEVNSRKRAQRIRREISKRLGERALFERETVESIEAMLAARQGVQGGGKSSADEEVELAPPPEIAARLAEMHRTHWEQWLDDCLPVLGGKTPREAARSAKGRERLEALFLEFESNAAPNPMAPDVTALRRALGL
jgi:hypothetical protein